MTLEPKIQLLHEGDYPDNLTWCWRCLDCGEEECDFSTADGAWNVGCNHSQICPGQCPGPIPIHRHYSPAEIEAFCRIHRKVWTKPYNHHEGPPWFATGDFWPSELRTRAEAYMRDAEAFRVAADAMEREGCR